MSNNSILVERKTSPEYNMLSENLKYLRNTSNMSQTEFGQIFGLKRNQIERAENKKWQPPANVLQKIADKFSYTVDDLIKGHLSEVKKGQGSNEATAETLKLYERLLNEKDEKLRLVTEEKDKQILSYKDEVDYLKEQLAFQKDLLNKLAKNR